MHAIKIFVKKFLQWLYLKNIKRKFVFTNLILKFFIDKSLSKEKIKPKPCQKAQNSIIAYLRK